MILGRYQTGTSIIHRLWPGAKILLLCAFGTLLFAFDTLWLSALALGLVAALFLLADLHPATIARKLRPILWVFILILSSQAFLGEAAFGILLVLRLAGLVLLGSLVTLTTRSLDIVDALVRALTILRPLGVNPARVGLTISLTLRFLPVLAQVTREVSEAQHARGLGSNIVATAIPTTVRTLKMANDIAEAIDARGFD